MEHPLGEPPPDAFDALARVPFDEALDALSDARRRKLLFALLEGDPLESSVVLEGPDGGTDPTAERDEMNHVHLPKLADEGFVDWDREGWEVRRGPNFAEIEPLLELLDDNRDDLPVDWL